MSHTKKYAKIFLVSSEKRLQKLMQIYLWKPNLTHLEDSVSILEWVSPHQIRYFLEREKKKIQIKIFTLC